MINSQSAQDNCVPQNVLSPFDKKVVKLLQEDGRQSSELLAKKLDVHPTTVRRAIKRLTEDGIMVIEAAVNAQKAGEPVAAVLGIDGDPAKIDQMVDSLAAYSEVKLVSAAAGRYDIIVYGRFASNEHLQRFIQTNVAKLDGLRDTETFICFNVKKNVHTRIY